MINHLVLTATPTTKPIALLVPKRDFNKDLIVDNYIKPMVASGIPQEDIIVFDLESNNGKVTMTAAREYLAKLKPIMDSIGVESILCCDGQYFKALTKATKIKPHLSYRMDTLWPEQSAFYCPSFRQIFHNPRVIDEIDLAIKGLKAHHNDEDSVFMHSILENVHYPSRPKEIRKWIRDLLDMPELTCDIETFDLHPDKAGLGTIAFAWDKNSAVSFAIDLGPNGHQIRRWLKTFFTVAAKKGHKFIYHGASFDIKIMIWEIFMEDCEDMEGLLEGLEIFTNNFECTKTLSYLATNSAGGNELSLKAQAFEYTGDYAIDVKDITQHPLETVLEYNAMDACATWFVYHKHREAVREQQESVYQDVFLPSLKTIIQMELIGLPMNFGEILNAEIELDDIRQAALEGLYENEIIVYFTDLIRQKQADKDNETLVNLVRVKEDFPDMEFNPNSNPQLQQLLYEELGLPVISKTKNKQPSTDAKTLKALKKHEENSKKPRKDVIDLMTHLQHFAQVDILLNTFIPAFLHKSIDRFGWKFLMGNFNLGGTVSGRLSSSDPNLQNIPSTGTKFAKLIKKCFAAPPQLAGDPFGWLFVGADYFSLEDRISALLTKDPNKLKVYTDGYDGHCLRAYSYFPSQMADITAELSKCTDGPSMARVINSIEERYPDLRQLSKGPTFALTYMGTWKTLVKTFGISRKEAMQIEKNYHDLYGVSDAWVQAQIAKAADCGYVELAFGLRLRTPMLPQVILTSYDSLPYEAYQEVKTAANALGQSYGLLNSYSANMFMNRVWSHSEYRTWILPCAHIHDSQYYLIKNQLACLKWANDNLVECMEWADLDAIRHPEVGLGSALEVYAPSWAEKVVLPNRASMAEIKHVLNTRNDNE